MKYILFFLLMSTGAKASDTMHVITHNKTVVVTDPAAGFKSYKMWGVFPNAGTDIRKIILHVKFGCPDSLRCADWDYLDFISIKRKGGVKSENLDYEVARMLTPYGGAFTKNWEFEWETDITDFGLLLRDSVEIEYYHSGYEPNHDRGWKITLDFEIIKGKPTVQPVSIHKIYSGSYKYGDSVSIEHQLTPYSFRKHKDAVFGALKISQTGHGMNPPDGCGEFCSKKREILINGKTIETRSLWKKCGDNPLFPQAGTWLIDRAYWCPGNLPATDDYYFPLSSENVVDVNMEPYFIQPNQAVENINAYVIQYKRNIKGNDVSIEDITVPSNKKIHGRKNPSGYNAEVIIKNQGNQPLTSLQILYGTKGFPEKKYIWNGHLSFGQKDTVLLPGIIESGKSVNNFIARLSAPNGKNDIYPADNTMESTFSKLPVHKNILVVAFKTNNQPKHNSIRVTDMSGQSLYERKFDSLDRDKIFYDTLRLSAGNYELMVEDTQGDGLEFWFNNRGGSGFFRLQDSEGNLLKQFESDFGSFMRYAFSVSDDHTQVSPYNLEPSVMVYPTRTTGPTTLNYFHGLAGDVKVQIITDDGAILIEDHMYKNLKAGTFTYDLSYRPVQRYYLKVFLNGELKYNKRIRVEGAQRRN